ncbi:MAG: flagellar export protein FliJ [Candidatus Cybelea sp.]
MAPFVFPLQALLDARRRKEEEKQRAFARVKGARDENLRDLGRLAGALRTGGRALHECVMSGSTASLRLYDAHLRYLERTLQAREQSSAESAPAFDRAASELYAANRERRLIEKLKERRLHAFERDEARRDERELDEANASFDRLRMTTDRLRMTTGGL